MARGGGGRFDNFVDEPEARGLLKGEYLDTSFEAWATLGTPSSDGRDRDDADDPAAEVLPPEPAGRRGSAISPRRPFYLFLSI